MWVALADRLVLPAMFLGYSVGEISAYACAGVWTAKELAVLITQRAELMDLAAPPSAGLMAVKGLDNWTTNEICTRHKLQIAIVNADDHVILGGDRVQLATAASEIVASGCWCQILDVAVPAHTRVMQGAAEAFRAVVARSSMKPPVASVIAGVNGCPTANAREIADTLCAQIAQPVRWQDCMNSAVESGVSVVLELCPGKSLSRMFNELDGVIESRSVEDFRTLDGIANWVGERAGHPR